MPFMDEPPGARLSSTIYRPYGVAVRALRSITNIPSTKNRSGGIRAGNLRRVISLALSKRVLKGCLTLPSGGGSIRWDQSIRS